MAADHGVGGQNRSAAALGNGNQRTVERISMEAG